MSSGIGTTGPNEAALPSSVSSHICDWWTDQLQWNTDLMLLIESPKMVEMVQSLGECKIKETLILGAFSQDHTKKAWETQNAAMWNCKFTVNAKP